MINDTTPTEAKAPEITGSCKCLQIIEEKLTKHHGEGSDVELDLKHTINTSAMEDTGTFPIGRALPPLYYSYKDGKKRRKSFVTFNFCPFCGESA